MDNNRKSELVAPAGNLLKMKTALAFGADAVYLGLPEFSLRVRINDFDIQGIETAVAYCRERKKRIYATLNIVAHNRHLAGLPSYLGELRRIGIDALIVSDPGLACAIREIWPDARLHLSTQANCCNWRSARFWHEQGFERVILGREVTLDEIGEIRAKVPGLELEYFVHGAMCMAYSGRCFLSSSLRGRSANQGDCSQPCRWPYQSLEIETDGPGERFELESDFHGSYILNSKDLRLLPYLEKLREAGVDAFKIEGRAKSVYYQAMIAGVYSSALAEAPIDPTFLNQELEQKLVHRGYTSGFLLGLPEENRLKSHEDCDWQFCGQIEEATSVEKENFNLVKVHNSIKQGDRVEVVMPLYQVEEIVIDRMYDEDMQELTEVHGGQGQTVFIPSQKPWPEYSVLRKKK